MRNSLNSGELRWKRRPLSGRLCLNNYLPVFTYWMQSPWFLKVLSARVTLANRYSALIRRMAFGLMYRKGHQSESPSKVGDD